MPAKFLAFLQADDMSPYYLLVIKSYTRSLLTDTNALNAFSSTMLKVEHSDFYSCFAC